jgi:hypothetical protein
LVQLRQETVNGADKMTTTFEERFAELLKTWTEYQDMIRDGAPLDSRAAARGRLVRLRAEVAAARRATAH